MIWSKRIVGWVLVIAALGLATLLALGLIAGLVIKTFVQIHA
jgi:hypothetical protein